MNEITRQKFLKVYADLPLVTRREIVLDIDGEPITWNAAYLEIKNRTSNGEMILQKLETLGFI